jgi:hypothetical protein
MAYPNGLEVVSAIVDMAYPKLTPNGHELFPLMHVISLPSATESETVVASRFASGEHEASIGRACGEHEAI